MMQSLVELKENFIFICIYDLVFGALITNSKFYVRKVLFDTYLNILMKYLTVVYDFFDMFLKA